MHKTWTLTQSTRQEMHISQVSDVFLQIWRSWKNKYCYIISGSLWQSVMYAKNEARLLHTHINGACEISELGSATRGTREERMEQRAGDGLMFVETPLPVWNTAPCIFVTFIYPTKCPRPSGGRKWLTTALNRAVSSKQRSAAVWTLVTEFQTCWLCGGGHTGDTACEGSQWVAEFTWRSVMITASATNQTLVVSRLWVQSPSFTNGINEGGGCSLGLFIIYSGKVRKDVLSKRDHPDLRSKHWCLITSYGSCKRCIHLDSITRFIPSPLTIFSLHRFTYEKECFSWGFSASGSQVVGLSAWEATTNPSLVVYFLYATLYELRHRQTQLCLMVGGRGWTQRAAPLKKTELSQKVHITAISRRRRALVEV